MAITFYYNPFSSAIRIHWALEELGIPYDKVKLDFDKGEQRKPEFLKLNPNGKVPTLVDDGTVYFESAAIFIHLGQKYGVERNLWPKANSPLYGPALSWTVWAAVTLGFHAGRLMFNSLESIPAELRHAGQAEKARKDVSDLLSILDARLTQAPYVLGEQFSLVDIPSAADMWWYKRGLSLDLSPWPQVDAWLTRTTQRPAFKTALGE